MMPGRAKAVHRFYTIMGGKAPSGGMYIGGTFYKGGQFLPEAGRRAALRVERMSMKGGGRSPDISPRILPQLSSGLPGGTAAPLPTGGPRLLNQTDATQGLGSLRQRQAWGLGKGGRGGVSGMADFGWDAASITTDISPTAYKNFVGPIQRTVKTNKRSAGIGFGGLAGNIGLGALGGAGSSLGWGAGPGDLSWKGVGYGALTGAAFGGLGGAAGRGIGASYGRKMAGRKMSIGGFGVRSNTSSVGFMGLGGYKRMSYGTVGGLAGGIAGGLGASTVGATIGNWAFGGSRRNKSSNSFSYGQMGSW